MPLEKATLLTIIIERVMGPTLRALVERAGASGYTIEEVAAGYGTRGSREGQIESDQTIKMLIVVSRSVAKVILRDIERTLQPDYAVLAFQHEVEVLTGPVKSAQ